MNLKQLFITVPAAFLMLGNAPAKAAQTINEAGALACVIDKWDEKEVEKDHKLVDAAVSALRNDVDSLSLSLGQQRRFNSSRDRRRILE